MKIGKYVLVKESDLKEIYADADMIEKLYAQSVYGEIDKDEKTKILTKISIHAMYITSTIKYLFGK